MSLFQVTKKQVIENYELRTITGDIVSFTPSYSQLLPDPFSDLNVTIDIEATGGNGTPDNPNPIVGYSSANITRCGVNLFDGSKVTTTTPSNWGVSFENDNLTIEHKTAYNTGVPSIDFNLFGTFIISFTTTQNNKCSLYENGSYKQLLNSGTQFTTTRGNTYFIVFSADDNTTNVFSNVQIETGNTATSYHAYNGTTHVILFGQTVYGGVLDVTRGKLGVTLGDDDLGDLSWTRWTNDSAYYIFYATLADKENTETNTGICSSFPILAINATGAGNAKGLLNTDNTACLSIGTSNPTIYIRCDTYTDAIAFQTAMSGQKIVYELATPFDIDLTPEAISAIVGTNNVFADCGQTTVTCLI